jgi:glycosyltransferase involved in cell wall biosynthesis
MNKKIITIVSPTYNEEENIILFYERVNNTVKNITDYQFEFLFIDNASTDKTVDLLKELAKKNKDIKIIVNTRNFGHIRSPYWGIIQSRGDATIYLASDLQDPPELINDLIKAWETGYKLALCVKPESNDHFFMHQIRKAYYKLLNKISDVEIVNNATGFGIYDRLVLDYVRQINDPYPFLRGLIAELGFEIKQINFVQEKRYRGTSKNNFYTLFDIGMLGIVSHSVVPLRIASFFGFILGGVSLLMSLVFISIKLLRWNEFGMGIAPIIIGMFFLFGLILFFIGLLGEYLASVHLYVRRRPIVVEKERINFEE